MLAPRPYLVAVLFLISSVVLNAQIRQLSISGTFAPVINTINVTEINYRAFGVSGEFEYKSKRHMSFGMELDWQRYTPEIVQEEPYQHASNFLTLEYTIYRYQVNLRPMFRYYWKDDFQGFYVGAFGAFSFLSTTPKERIDVPGYPNSAIDKAYNSAAGMGLTYGYRFKLSPAFRVSAFGNHQVVLSELYDDESAHQDHQWGLGLNWVF